MMHDKVRTDKSKPRGYRGRDLGLAQAVGKLPDSSLVGVEEVAAITGIAASSLRKPEQRKKIGMPEPSALGGRHLAWNLGVIRAWINGTGTSKVGRPTKSVSVMKQLASAQS